MYFLLNPLSDVLTISTLLFTEVKHQICKAELKNTSNLNLLNQRTKLSLDNN